VICDYEPGVTYGVLVAQLVGALVTGYGLLTTWCRYTGRPTPIEWARGRWASLRRPPRDVVSGEDLVVHVEDAAGSADALSAAVAAPTLDERVATLETAVSQLRVALDEHQSQARTYADDAVRASEQRVRDEVAQLAESIPAETRKVALDGIGLAAIGLGITAAATFVSLFVADCPA